MHQDIATKEQATEPNPWDTNLFDNIQLEQVNCRNFKRSMYISYMKNYKEINVD